MECVKAAHAALQAMTPLVKGLDDGAVTVEASGLLSAEPGAPGDQGKGASLKDEQAQDRQECQG